VRFGTMEGEQRRRTSSIENGEIGNQEASCVIQEEKKMT